MRNRKQPDPKRDTRKKIPGSQPADKRAAEPEASQPSPTNPEFALTPPPRPEDYADYVEHPRFGKAPRFTGLDPNPDSPEVNLHRFTEYQTEGQRRSWERMLADMEDTFRRIWASPLTERLPVLVPGTAVEADLSRQTYATIPVTHYYDLDRTCTDCVRKFIFFAEEQKHWYEELGFPIDADAVRCPLCRKRLQNIARTRKRYEQLLALSSRSGEEMLEMADCCLTLIEAEVFPIRQCERVRMLLKRVPEDRRSEEKFRELTARMHAVERRARGEQAAAPAAAPTTWSDDSATDEEPEI